MLESKLPFETLGKIWDLADQDKDGMLDRYEFIAVSIVHSHNILHAVVSRYAFIKICMNDI